MKNRAAHQLLADGHHGDTPGESKPAFDIIWNATKICVWDCDICCVDATHVTKRDGQIFIRSEALRVEDQIPFVGGAGSPYDQALAYVQRQGLELTFAEKMAVLENLQGFDVKLDFSGGDVLCVGENLEVLRSASQLLGKHRVTLTATGAGMTRIDAREVGGYIKELNFTYDSPDFSGNDCRPTGYAAGNLKKAAQFARLGVVTRGECPLSQSNIDDESLRKIYRNLHDAGTDQMLIMRLFPVGRGEFRTAHVPSAEQYRRAIDVLRHEEAKFGTPRIKLQCALKFFDQEALTENPCDMVRESFGLMADGTLLASPWAINAVGGPLNEEWVLGNLSTTPFGTLLQTEKAKRFVGRLDENHGHCKIFSFLYSKRADAFERMFDAADPLYSGDSALEKRRKAS